MITNRTKTIASTLPSFHRFSKRQHRCLAMPTCRLSLNLKMSLSRSFHSVAQRSPRLASFSIWGPSTLPALLQKSAAWAASQAVAAKDYDCLDSPLRISGLSIPAFFGVLTRSERHSRLSSDECEHFLKRGVAITEHQTEHN